MPPNLRRKPTANQFVRLTSRPRLRPNNKPPKDRKSSRARVEPIGVRESRSTRCSLETTRSCSRKRSWTSKTPLPSSTRPYRKLSDTWKPTKIRCKGRQVPATKNVSISSESRTTLTPHDEECSTNQHDIGRAKSSNPSTLEPKPPPPRQPRLASSNSNTKTDASNTKTDASNTKTDDSSRTKSQTTLSSPTFNSQTTFTSPTYNSTTTSTSYTTTASRQILSPLSLGYGSIADSSRHTDAGHRSRHSTADTSRHGGGGDTASKRSGRSPRHLPLLYTDVATEVCTVVT